jgi:hypothetical protein
MLIDTRHCDINQKPRNILKLVKKLQSKPCIYKRMDGEEEYYIFESRKPQIVGKVIIDGKDKYTIVSDVVDKRISPQTNKLYNLYLLKKTNAVQAKNGIGSSNS